MSWIRNWLARIGRHVFAEPTPTRAKPPHPTPCRRLGVYTQGGSVLVHATNPAGNAAVICLTPAQADLLARQLKAATLAVAVINTTTETQA